MAERQNMNSNDIAAAWQNSGGQLVNSRPFGSAKCPWRRCSYGLMQAADYGADRPSDWVVDHKQALNNGGSNNHVNLQAMHNVCNSEKGDSY